MPRIGRKDVLMLMLGLGSKGTTKEGVSGITRLQKLLFLLEQEEGLRPTTDGFEFTPYKAGPFSSKVYDDLELLENLGLIESSTVGTATEPEAAELDALDFDELLGDGADTDSDGPTDGLGAADAYEETKYRLSAAGLERVQDLLQREELGALVDGIRRIKSRFGHHSLDDLLYHVYTQYPDMTTESEIKAKVFRRKRSRS